jgi:hypothetical protein
MALESTCAPMIYCTVYGPVRNIYAACRLQIYYEGKWEEVGFWKSRLRSLPFQGPKKSICTLQKHYVRGRMNHRCMHITQLICRTVVISSDCSGIYCTVQYCSTYRAVVCCSPVIVYFYEGGSMYSRRYLSKMIDIYGYNFLAICVYQLMIAGRHVIICDSVAATVTA